MPKVMYPKSVSVPCTLDEWNELRLRAAREKRPLGPMLRSYIFPDKEVPAPRPVKRKKGETNAEAGPEEAFNRW